MHLNALETNINTLNSDLLCVYFVLLYKHMITLYVRWLKLNTHVGHFAQRQTLYLKR